MKISEPIVERLLIVGAGDVVAKRLLPSIVELNLAERIVILHNGICEFEENIDSRVKISDVGGLAALEMILRINRDPVFVATPPQPRMVIAQLARSRGAPVILEKPLVATRQELSEARGFRTDSKAFALSYYVQEKALGWTWLCTQSPVLARYLVTGSGDRCARAGELAANLGPLRQFSIRINEAAERSGHANRPTWYSQTPNGIWLDMGVHAMSLVMLGALRESGKTEIQVTDATSLEQADQLRFLGNAGKFVFDATFGKNFPNAAKQRWLNARFDHGAFFCDFDTGICTLTHHNGVSETLAPLRGEARYRTMMTQVGNFLRSSGWHEGRHDFIDLQCDALNCIFDCVGV